MFVDKYLDLLKVIKVKSGSEYFIISAYEI